MSDYYVDYDIGIPTETLDDIKKSYHFVVAAMQTISESIVVKSQEFQLRIGEVIAVIDNYEEFISSAYGQSVKLVIVNLRFERDGNDYASVLIKPKWSNKEKNITICSSSMLIIDEIGSAFSKYKQTNEEPLRTNFTNIIQSDHYQGDHIEIKENANIVGSNIGGFQNQVIHNSDNPITNESPSDSAKNEKVSFLKSIWANIVSNWVWWMIGTIVTAVLLKWGFKF